MTSSLIPSRAPSGLREPIVQAEIIAAGWEVFSSVLFVSAVVPGAFYVAWPAVLFAASIVISAALSRALAAHGTRGLIAAALLRPLAWAISIYPLADARGSRVLAAALVFGAMGGWMRWLVYRRWLETPDVDHNDKQLLASLRFRLTESSMIVGIIGGHILLLFSVAFLRTQSEIIFRAWFEIIPWLALVGTVGFALAVRPFTRSMIAALTAGSSGEQTLLKRGLAQALKLPARLAYLNFGAWLTCTSIGTFYYALPETVAWGSVSFGDAAMQLLFGVLFSFGVSFYQLLWHKDTLAPAVERLRRWTGAEAWAEPISLRRKMLREFGVPLVFTCTLSLFSSIGLYRALAVDLPQRHDASAVLALFASFVMLIVAAGSLVARSSGQVSRPMTELAEAANLVAKGHLDSAVPRVSGPVEVVGLGESIERMRDGLARTIAELSRERAGLEANVEARTAELRRALDELRHAQAALVQGERLASIGELVSGVAHEIYNPLNAIAGASEPLERIASELRTMMAAYREAEAELPPERRRALAELRAKTDADASLDDLVGISLVVRRATDRSVRIVQNLKNFSRVTGEALPADLRAGLEETLMLLAPRLRSAGIDVKKTYADIPPVICRAGEMNQVFMNLLVNAVQALEGSTEGEKVITIDVWVDGESVAVAIEDNGPGVPEEIARRIFDPFFTTKPKGQGTGLGLSISTDITRRQGGTLTLEPKPGDPKSKDRGARFVCRVPKGAR